MQFKKIISFRSFVATFGKFENCQFGLDYFSALGRSNPLSWKRNANYLCVARYPKITTKSFQIELRQANRSY